MIKSNSNTLGLRYHRSLREVHGMTEGRKYYRNIKKIFGTLPDDEIENLCIVHYAAGEPLMEENAIDDASFYYLLEGVAEGRRIMPIRSTASAYHIPVKIEKGDFVGLYEALQNEPKRRRMGIYAKSNVTALKITRNQFYRWVQRDPTIFNNLVSQILLLSWHQQDLINGTNGYGTHIRLAFHLRNLYSLYRSSCYDEEYTGPVRILDTRQEMSVAIGSSVRTVYRIIDEFKSLDFISILRGKIYINEEQIERLSDYIAVNS